MDKMLARDKSTDIESKNKNRADSSKRNSNKWTQTRRLEFIDFRLGIDGKINRQDLVDYFGISVPQASLDLSHYHELVASANPPRLNLVYDRHLKVYLRSDDFKPLYPELCAPESFLNDLLLSARGELIQSRNFFGFTPSVGVAAFAPPSRNINFIVLRNLIEAIHTHKAVHINYMSLKNDKNVDRLIAPHAFAYDGMRWHVRAYCYERHDFRDYVLSRILQCDEPNIAAPNDRFADPLGNGFREVGTSGRDDKDWNDLVDLVLRANPELPERTRRVIEMDYGMSKDGTITYPCRRALLFYALQYMRLNQEAKVLPAIERLVVLDNETEVYRRLAGGN